jgi:hypothetical protein
LPSIKKLYITPSQAANLYRSEFKYGGRFDAGGFSVAKEYIIARSKANIRQMD